MGSEQILERDLKAKVGPKPKQNTRVYVNKGKKGESSQKLQELRGSSETCQPHSLCSSLEAR